MRKDDSCLEFDSVQYRQSVDSHGGKDAVAFLLKTVLLQEIIGG